MKIEFLVSALILPVAASSQRPTTTYQDEVAAAATSNNFTTKTGREVDNLKLRRLRRGEGQRRLPKKTFIKVPKIPTKPSPSPPAGATTKCSSDCPCCNPQEWPEFVAAVERYTGPPDSCFVRVDDNSDIIALDLCETITLEGGWESGITAYMSMDYEGRYGSPNIPAYYCGDSSSNVNFVTKEQGAACRELLISTVEQENGVCDDVFECST